MRNMAKVIANVNVGANRQTDQQTDRAKTICPPVYTGGHKKLADYGITGYCFHYLRAFLEGRKIQVRIDGELSEVAITDRETPQGSVISPTLFSLIENGLPDAVKDSPSLPMTQALG
ncbi:hypothetical protein DPMN_073620 [Dreissena polymorpha]|uniref:Reverse transcriptase n=1 Tax=Dreissena polymorpha TaxID=45954 RepID=A0A9D4HBC5_DREPO|nr:hypothetical protein DPMN_073620 [Dreissena polymorpha]